MARRGPDVLCRASEEVEFLRKLARKQAAPNAVSVSFIMLPFFNFLFRLRFACDCRMLLRAKSADMKDI